MLVKDVLCVSYPLSHLTQIFRVGAEKMHERKKKKVIRIWKMQEAGITEEEMKG